MNKENMPSPDEVGKIEKSRAESDTEAVRAGAEFISGGKIEFTEDQIDKARMEMEIAEQDKRLSEEIRARLKSGKKIEIGDRKYLLGKDGYLTVEYSQYGETRQETYTDDQGRDRTSEYGGEFKGTRKESVTRFYVDYTLVPQSLKKDENLKSVEAQFLDPKIVELRKELEWATSQLNTTRQEAIALQVILEAFGRKAR
jgi:hypothetical protein